jgi:pimeloyl-ACP methyl ester carboxylesterase
MGFDHWEIDRMLSKKIEVSGLYVFYREAGREDAPKLVLLHGFPASSHQCQAFLRRNQPKTIIFWGQNDIFFTREGGESYLKDLPRAEMHRLNSGHFAVEDPLQYIAEAMVNFYRRACPVAV